MRKSPQPKENELCQEEISPVTVRSKKDRLSILKRATKSVERPKRKLRAVLGRLLTSRTKGGKRAAADAEKNPAMQVRAKVGAKAAKRRKNRHMLAEAFPAQRSLRQVWLRKRDSHGYAIYSSMAGVTTSGPSSV